MTLQEVYDLAIERGATPNSEVIIEYCDVSSLVVEDDKIFIN